MGAGSAVTEDKLVRGRRAFAPNTRKSGWTYIHRIDLRQIENDLTQHQKRLTRKA